MIAHLRGRLLAKHPNQAVVETGGVGYDVTISIPTFSDLPGLGSEVALHIHTHVREDQIALYGFLRPAEKQLFEKLITVSGIGAKLAITILSGMPADEMVGAIRGNDIARLTRIPGIGKKTAERMVLELRDKLPPSGGAETPAVPVMSVIEEDVLSALVNLGYQRTPAERALASVAKNGKDGSFETMFRNTLAALASNTAGFRFASRATTIVRYCYSLLTRLRDANDGRCLMTVSASLPFVLAMSFAVAPSPLMAQAIKTNSTGIFACAVTHPNGIQPPVKDFGGTVTYAANYHGPRHIFPGPYAHGNGKLWTVLPLDGKIVMAPDPGGSISDKFMWWRAARGVLTIEGHRLDAPAAPAVPNVPRGYHDTGFQASSITFPTEGCWQITGRAGDSKLTFVVEVHAKK